MQPISEKSLLRKFWRRAQARCFPQNPFSGFNLATAFQERATSILDSNLDSEMQPSTSIPERNSQVTAKPKTNFVKVRHDRDFRLEHEGKHWIVEVAEWRDHATGKGELRAYRIDGDVTTPLLREALELEAASRGLAWATEPFL